LFLERVLKFLGDGDAREEAADLGFHVGVLERADGFGAVRADNLKRTLSSTVLRRRDRARASEPLNGDQCSREDPDKNCEFEKRFLRHSSTSGTIRQSRPS